MSQYTSEQVERQASLLSGTWGVGEAYKMLRAYAANLRQQADRESMTPKELVQRIKRGEKWLPAFEPPGQQAVGVDESMQQRAESWDAIVALLDELSPRWWDNEKNGINGAKDAIRALAQREQPDSVPPREPNMAMLREGLAHSYCPPMSAEALSRIWTAMWDAHFQHGQPLIHESAPITNESQHGQPCDGQACVHCDPEHGCKPQHGQQGEEGAVVIFLDSSVSPVVRQHIHRVEDASGREIPLGDKPCGDGLTCVRLYTRPAARARVPEMLEEIAQQWDGCMYDAPGEMLDIGECIRSASRRLAAAPSAESGGGAAVSWAISESVPKEAAALRPWRMKNEQAVHFTAVYFEQPYKGCELTIRRMDAFGMVAEPHDGPLSGERFVDVLDAQGDILTTFEINRKGFEYLRRTLRVTREPATTHQEPQS